MTVTTGPGTDLPTSGLDPFADDFLDDPYEAHARLRDAGPVVLLERYRVYAMARHAEVSQALNDPGTFCSSAGVGLSDFRKEQPWRPPSLLLEADPPDHTRARHLVTSVLTPKVVRTLKDDFLGRARTLVADLVERGRFDAVPDLAEAFPLAVFPDVVGLPVEGRENLLPYGAMVFNGFGPRNAHFERAFADAQAVSGWIMAHCERDALAPGGFGMKIHEAAAAEGYAAEDGARIVRSFLSAGVDTTVHALGNAMHGFVDHPDQWEALRADLKLARPAFEEVVRYSSPVQTFFRTTTRDAEIGGTVVPDGEKVLLFLGSANRDPREWEHADRFDVRRRAAGHVGFGQGIHACVGQMIARLEGEVVLTALAEQVASIEVDGPVERQLNNTLRGLSSLPVRVTPA